MSLFIATLAFEGTSLLDSAKLGILAASALAGIVGAIVVRRGMDPPDNPRPGRLGSSLRMARSTLLALAIVVSSFSVAVPRVSDPARVSVATRLAPDPSRVAEMSPELRRRLATTPMALFRFVNQAWTQEVCEAFRSEAEALPTAMLHGDAHIKQYALTATGRGLDDFDDSDRGPAVIDIVRFLAVLELATAQRGWTDSLPATIDAFLPGTARDSTTRRICRRILPSSSGYAARR